MYNKIKFLLLLAVLLSSSFVLYGADEDSSSEYSGEGEQNAILVKEANLVKISALQYVFVETQGSLEDTFQREIDIVSSYVLRYGIPDRKVGILFLDLDTPEDGGRYKLQTQDKNPSKIDKKFLYEQYGESFFGTTRKVLVGVLIMPNETILSADNIKVYNVKPTKARVRQTYFIGLSKNVYTMEKRSLDRGTMIDYMGSNSKDKYPSLGMMELYDSQTDSYIFIDFPGDKVAFMKEQDISVIGQAKKETEETK